MEYATLAFRFLLATLFLFAGLSKLRYLATFESAVRRYRVLPERIVRPIARALPPFELACGLLLMLGLEIRIVSALLAATLFVFASAITVNLLQGHVIDCGCFSTVAPRRISWSTVARNVLLAGAAVAVAATRPDALALDRMVTNANSNVSSADAAGILIASASCLAASALYAAAVAFRRAAANFGRHA